MRAVPGAARLDLGLSGIGVSTPLVLKRALGLQKNPGRGGGRLAAGEVARHGSRNGIERAAHRRGSRVTASRDGGTGLCARRRPRADVRGGSTCRESLSAAHLRRLPLGWRQKIEAGG